MSRRKTRVRYDRIVILSVSVVAFIGIIFGIFNSTSVKNYFFSKKTGYSIETVKVFREKDILKDVSSNKYSNTLESAISSNSYIDKYLTDYLHIKYKDDKDFISDVNSLLEVGYNYNEINKIEDTLSSDSIAMVIDSEYNKQLFDYLGLSYFKEDNLERYFNYYKDNSDMDYTDIITFVNIGLDNEHYTNVIDVDKQDDILVLVNKYHKLSSDYVPSDLEILSSKYAVGTQKLRKEAKDKFMEMCDAAKEDGISIKAGSTYRSYSYQQGLYNRYVNRDGKKEADRYSARAGYSEHQTGLAIDILNGKNEFIDEDNKEYDWLVNNCYKFGYILRYTKEDEAITGYQFESWHFRYVGTEVAMVIKDTGLTYDEYMARK